MRIDEILSNAIRTADAIPRRAAEPAGQPPAGGEPVAPDGVARAVGPRLLVLVSETAAAPGLSPERVAELRRRLFARTDDPARLVDELARRILARGDI